jgi:CheY-like chemotaxis protein
MRTRPLALLVEDDREQQFVISFCLRRAGFDVTIARNQLEGERAAMAVLTPTSMIPVMVVLELGFYEHGPTYKGWLLAHALVRRMSANEIRRAFVVVLSNVLSHAQENVADIADCHFICPKPFTASMAEELFRWMQNPILLPEEPLASQPRFIDMLWLARKNAEQALDELRTRS